MKINPQNHTCQSVQPHWGLTIIIIFQGLSPLAIQIKPHPGFLTTAFTFSAYPYFTPLSANTGVTKSANSFTYAAEKSNFIPAVAYSSFSVLV